MNGYILTFGLCALFVVYLAHKKLRIRHRVNWEGLVMLGVGLLFGVIYAVTGLQPNTSELTGTLVAITPFVFLYMAANNF